MASIREDQNYIAEQFHNPEKPNQTKKSENTLGELYGK
jgi:hypothetical protein